MDSASSFSLQIFHFFFVCRKQPDTVTLYPVGQKSSARLSVIITRICRDLEQKNMQWYNYSCLESVFKPDKW